jgi:hypothetical protein
VGVIAKEGMPVVTAETAHRSWIRAERIKRLADRLVGLGPFSIGLDGLLAPVPFAGTLFSLVAGICLVWEGIKAGASRFTLARMIFYVGFRTVASAIPMEGWLVDVLFRGHMRAANALQKDIVRRFGAPPQSAIRAVRRRPASRPGPLHEPLGAI